MTYHIYDPPESLIDVHTTKGWFLLTKDIYCEAQETFAVAWLRQPMMA